MFSIWPADSPSQSNTSATRSLLETKWHFMLCRRVGSLNAAWSPVQAGLLAPFVLACSRAAEQSNSKKPPEAALAFAPPTFAHHFAYIVCMFTLVAPTSKKLDFLDSSPTFRLYSPTLRSKHFFLCPGHGKRSVCAVQLRRSIRCGYG